MILSLDKNDLNNFGSKDHLSKNYPHTEKWCFNLKGLLWHVLLPGANESKKKGKEKMIVMSYTWKFWLSLNENQEKNVDKMMKNCKNTNHFFSCKELLFNLGNCVWNEKWPSFIILHWCRKLSIVTPFEPDDFLSITRPRIILHTRGKGKRYSLRDYKCVNARCWKANLRN